MTPIVNTLAQDLRLLSGGHRSSEAGMCVMEAVAFVAGEQHSDAPVCACPVIGAFLRSWNDALPTDDDRTRLLGPLVTRLVDSKSTAEVELHRSYLAFDWLARVQAPAWMDLSPSLVAHAATLRGLAPLADKASVAAASASLAAARDAARAAARAAARDAARAAARDAARAAAGDAAWAAAWAAARDAAWAAVRDAAWAAAWAAARAASGAAAWDAAGAALKPTVVLLQASALDLIERMLNIKPTDETGMTCPEPHCDGVLYIFTAEAQANRRERGINQPTDGQPRCSVCDYVEPVNAK